MKPKDGSYYWLKWAFPSEWTIGLWIEDAGWQLPGVLYSVDPDDYRILAVGEEVARKAA